MHYVACIFRYIREYAILFHRFSVFACLNKHEGELGFLVVAAEHGRQVLVHSSFEVGDHNFTILQKTSILVSFLVDIPDVLVYWAGAHAL